MKNSNSLVVHRPRLLNFRESLIYVEAVRRRDFHVCRSIESMAVMRLFGIPANVLSGEPSYSHGKMDVASFE